MQTVQLKMELCKSMCCTEDGGVIVSGTTDKSEPSMDTFKIHWYNRDVSFKQVVPHPKGCAHYSIGVVEVTIQGEKYVATCCYMCKVISLYSPRTGQHTIAYKQEDVAPFKICRGGPKELCAISKKKVIVFDTSTTEFTIKSELDFGGGRAEYLSYYKHPEEGGVIVTTEGNPFFQAQVCSISTGKLLFKIGGKDKEGQVVPVAGSNWAPLGVCTNGYDMFIADMRTQRVIMLDGETGRVIQTVAPPQLGKVVNVAWFEKERHLVAEYEKDDKCYVSYFDMH